MSVHEQMQNIRIGLTLDEISELVGRNKSTVHRRKGLDSFFVGYIKEGPGRSCKVYDPQVLALWGIAKADIEKSEQITRRKRRNDKGTPRRPRGASKKERIKIRDSIVNRTFQLWMLQARSDNVLPCCLDACIEYAEINGTVHGFDNPEDMANYYYQKFIKRNDKHYQGAYFKDSWQVKHMNEWRNRDINNKMPQNSWDYISLLKDYNLIGEGYGAGDLWVVDASDLDTYVKIDNKPQKLKYLQIMCGVTRYPMLIRPLLNGESILEVQRIIAQAYSIYGVPRLGVVLDNGRAFSSAATEYLIKSLYRYDELQEFTIAEWRRAIFPHQKKAPLFYNMPNRPQYHFKAAVERSFREHDKFATRFNPKSYIGPPGGQQIVQHNFSTMPYNNMKMAKDASEVWDAFNRWLYGRHVHSIQPKTLTTFRKTTGKPPTILKAWEYYGGLKEGGRTNIKKIPKENEPYLLYYLTPEDREHKHRVTVTDFGYIRCQHRGEQMNYHCKSLDPSFANNALRICVVPRWDNPEIAYLYLEHNPKRDDERVPDEGMVYYIGQAENHVIRNKQDINKIKQRQINQEHQQNWLDGHDPVEIADVNTKYKELPCIIGTLNSRPESDSHESSQPTTHHDYYRNQPASDDIISEKEDYSEIDDLLL